MHLNMWEMSKRSEQKNTYPFYWLDEVTEITLNPDKNTVKSFNQEHLPAIRERLSDEFSRIGACLKSQAFCLYSSDQLKVVAGHYDQSIKLLQRQAMNNLSKYPKSGLLRQTGEQLLNGLNELAQSVYTRYAPYLPEPPAEDNEAPENTAGLLTKVLCALSTDQLGILLRAAFDVKLIIGNSFRKVCQAIAPCLSTIWKKSVSWDSIRSNAGRPEQRDKEIAIRTLEQMIEKIKGYH